MDCAYNNRTNFQRGGDPMRPRFPFGAIHASTAAVLLCASLAHAQALTGSLFGIVKDETGAVLPGASVEVSSPALIAGPATAITDEKGQFRFPSLAPGEYTLEIALPHFASYREDAIPIRVGGSIERIVSLQLAVAGADV